MKRLIYVLMLFTILLAGCQKDLHVPEVDKFVIEIGSASDAYSFSDLVKPDTVYKARKHTTIRQLDLNNDLIPEILLISKQDTINGMLAIKELKIVKNPAISYPVYIAVENPNPPFYIKPFTDRSTVDVLKQDRLSLKSEHLLAGYSMDLTTKEEVINGNWNGRKQQSFIIMMESEGISIYSWIKISVTDFDNYIFFNYASYLDNAE